LHGGAKFILVVALAGIAGCTKTTTRETAMTFREMHLAAIAKMEKGMSGEAASRAFLGRSTKVEAIAGEAMRGICTVCYEMIDGDIKFIALPHPDLDPLKFGIFVERNRGQKVHIIGIVAAGPNYLAGSTRGTLVPAPLAIKVLEIGL
jgi:hypothetical protein